MALSIKIKEMDNVRKALNDHILYVYWNLTHFMQHIANMKT